ncbi:hypothetical protein [Pseudonocardia sp. KRD291]|uniref:hypothetical protein n=1 Tax=Pseudonocardia sp. KRD291 TaxID=2792007 RepID=UPI001C4A1CFA|nr:hypothetical protein [Pseudonocardia sp. KRD291]MBW0101302.1 hypothetical protein [Pseudonocardia sp. KRD291]
MSTPPERTRPATTDGTIEQADAIAGRLAPYIAWLAVQLDNEATRRTYREVAEHYLQWCAHDRGPTAGRRARYCTDGAASLGYSGALVRDALDRLFEHERVRACTLPVDG